MAVELSTSSTWASSARLCTNLPIIGVILQSVMGLDPVEPFPIQP